MAEISRPALKAGDHSVYSSGSVVSLGSEAIRVYPAGDEHDAAYFVEIQFPEDAEHEASTDGRPSDDGEGTIITMWNTIKSHGAGMAGRVRVADLADKALFFLLSTRLQGEGETATRVTFYTFTLGLRADD